MRSSNSGARLLTNHSGPVIHCTHGRWTTPLSIAHIGIAILLLSSSAQSQTSNHEERYYYTEFEQHWYGWQTLAVDLPTLTVFFIAQSKGNRALAFSSIGLFVVGSPTIHALHRRPVPAVVSGFAHFLLPIAGYLLERPVFSKIVSDASRDTGYAIALTVGGLAASALDVFVLAYDQREVEVPIEVADVHKFVPNVAFSGQSLWLAWQF